MTVGIVDLVADISTWVFPLMIQYESVKLTELALDHVQWRVSKSSPTIHSKCSGTTKVQAKRNDNHASLCRAAVFPLTKW
jgi:hypothetical protein